MFVTLRDKLQLRGWTSAAPGRWAAEAYHNWAFSYAAYFIFLACIFLTNTLVLAHYIFIFAVLPAVLANFLGAAGRRPADQASILSSFGSLMEPLATLHRSFVLRAAAVYVLAIWLATALYGDPGPWSRHSPFVWRVEQFGLSIEVLAFAAVTSCLMSEGRHFARLFFTVSASVAAASALINMVGYAVDVPFSGAIYNYRLIPWLGMPEYLGSTTVNLTYSVFLAGAIGTMIDLPPSYARMALLGPSAILSTAVLWTQSRNAVIAIGISSVIVAAMKSRRARFLAPAFLVIFVALLFLLPPTRDAILHRDIYRRPEIWDHFVSKAVKRPLLGYGQFANINVTLHDGLVEFHPHNLVFSAQLRGGVFAAGAMIGMLFGGLIWTWRYWRLTQRITPLFVMLIVVCAGVFDYQILVTFPTWPWVTFWLPIGLAVGAEQVVRRERSR